MKPSARLGYRRLRADDAAFVLELLNDPAWLANIGDRGIRDLESARAYALKMAADVEVSHFGMYGVEFEGRLIGLTGLIKRDWLKDVDVGYALLPAYRGKGLASEALGAAVAHAKDLGFTTLVAIVSPNNVKSCQVLQREGFVRDGEVTVPGEKTPIFHFRKTLSE